jgi:hypothetical protein
MTPNATSQKIWPLPVAIVSAVVVFAGTFFAYAERHRLNQGGSYAPVLIGVLLFLALMIVFTFAMLPKERRSIVVVGGIVFGETLAFVVVLTFLVLNAYGS